MRKIPTLFRRPHLKGTSVTEKVTTGCEWVLEGEGVATVKLDGTCCMIDDHGSLWKRRTVRKGKPTPQDFQLCESDPATGKSFGWVPVTPEDKYHIEGLLNLPASPTVAGTYELIGPKVQGNPEKHSRHILVSHDYASLEIDEPSPRDRRAIIQWLHDNDAEGIVWHHPDGRMAKIKKRDFGMKR